MNDGDAVDARRGPFYNRVMRRRHFVLGLATASLGGFSLNCKSSHDDGPGSKPNVLVVIVDQMRAPTWFRPGSLEAATPRLQRLLAKSVRFESHTTAATMCTASRAT